MFLTSSIGKPRSFLLLVLLFLTTVTGNYHGESVRRQKSLVIDWALMANVQSGLTSKETHTLNHKLFPMCRNLLEQGKKKF